MRFFLRADPKHNGTLRVRHWFEYATADGKLVRGLVDDDIIKQNREEYEAFRTHVEANEEELFEAAKKEFKKGDV